jgi:hypothetical protein
MQICNCILERFLFIDIVSRVCVWGGGGWGVGGGGWGADLEGEIAKGWNLGPAHHPRLWSCHVGLILCFK